MPSPAPYLLLILILAGWTAACERPVAPQDPSDHTGLPVGANSSLVPSHAQEKLMREQTLAQELRLSIEQVDGVDRARVHLTLADRSPLSADRTSETTCAVVLRPRPGAAVDRAMIEALATAAVPGLAPSGLKVFESGGQTRRPAEKTLFIGPIEVTKSSSTVARICLGALLLTCLGLALLVIHLGLKLRRLRSAGR